MGAMSKRKGARGELELAKFLSARGFKSRRGRQFCGHPSAPDVVSTLPFYIECKRTETLNAYKSLGQAEENAGDKPVVVFHRRNNKPWIVIITADEFLKVLKQKKS